MNTALSSLPGRILKRAEVDAGPARPAASDGALPVKLEVAPGAPPARRLAKEARLVEGTQGAAGASVLEVRCSCGEWTRLELHSGDRSRAEEPR